MEQIIQSNSLKSILESVRLMGHLSDQELVVFENKIEIRKMPKGSFLLQEGEICRSIYFLNSGSVKHYRVADDGAERVLNLFVENDWVLDYKSFTGQKPSIGFIACCEECELARLTIQALHELIAQSQSFFQIGRLLDGGMKYHDHTHSPADRYNELLKSKPRIIQKFALKDIASYLQMTPETLSRVRSKK